MSARHGATGGLGGQHVHTSDERRDTLSPAAGASGDVGALLQGLRDRLPHGAVTLTIRSPSGVSGPGAKLGVVQKGCGTEKPVRGRHKGLHHKLRGDFLRWGAGAGDMPNSGSRRRGQAIVQRQVGTGEAARPLTRGPQPPLFPATVTAASAGEDIEAQSFKQDFSIIMRAQGHSFKLPL